MEYIINGFTPAPLFRFFEDISAIPRGSGNEAGIASFLVEFAEKRGLEVLRDAANNVFIRKPASPDYEKAPAVLFQGHTDMVCEKNAATVHDFLRDPLRLKVKDGFLSAEGTTLGADDGAAVALMLALLDDDTLAHPTIECLMTSGEETGLIGAGLFDYSAVTARRMINLDSETEGEVTVSCAGGVRTALTLDCDRVPAPPLKALAIRVTGLAGGHSGAEIHLGRANAIQTLGRILANLYRKEPFQLIGIGGGLKSNAIPREASCRITAADPEGMTRSVRRLEAEIRAELTGADAGFRVYVTKGGAYDAAFTFADTSRAIALLTLPQTGVLSMCPAMPELVESSSNLGVVTQEENKVTFLFESRSSVESKLDDLCLHSELLAKAVGASCSHSARYPGWKFAETSPLREHYCRAYTEENGKPPRVLAIHAGLECGLIVGRIPDMDVISIGPNVHDIHTPFEKLELASCERTWRLVVRMLAEMTD